MSEITEIIYTWPGGREEVRYRRPKDSEGAKKLIDQVECLKARACGETPYSYRHVPGPPRVHARTKIGIVCGIMRPRHAIDWKKFFHIEPGARCTKCYHTLIAPGSAISTGAPNDG